MATLERRPVALVWAWLPAAAMMTAIWVLSSRALPSVPLQSFPLEDKGVHALAYAVLGALVMRASQRTFLDAPWRATARVAFAITVAWGILDEVHQAFVPNRSADALDLIADTIGALLGVLGTGLIRTRPGRDSAAR